MTIYSIMPHSQTKPKFQHNLVVTRTVSSSSVMGCASAILLHLLHLCLNPHLRRRRPARPESCRYSPGPPTIRPPVGTRHSPLKRQILSAGDLPEAVLLAESTARSALASAPARIGRTGSAIARRRARSWPPIPATENVVRKAGVQDRGRVAGVHRGVGLPPNYFSAGFINLF